MNPNTSVCNCDQNRAKFSSLVFDVWCSQGFQDAQARSVTDRSEYSMPPSPFFSGDGGRKTKKMVTRTLNDCLGIALNTRSEGKIMILVFTFWQLTRDWLTRMTTRVITRVVHGTRRATVDSRARLLWAKLTRLNTHGCDRLGENNFVCSGGGNVGIRPSGIWQGVPFKTQK